MSILPNRFDVEQTELPSRLHAASGFDLGHPHDDVQCSQCHDRSLPFAERHPGREATDCKSCHDDPHGGQFNDSPLAADGCVSCHDRTHFLPMELPQAVAALVVDPTSTPPGIDGLVEHPAGTVR